MGKMLAFPQKHLWQRSLPDLGTMCLFNMGLISLDTT